MHYASRCTIPFKEKNEMRIVVTSEGNSLDSAMCPIFGRCPNFVFVDTETMAFEAVPNPGAGARGGAGVRAANFVVAQGAKAVVTGNVGPNVQQVLRTASLQVFLGSAATVRQAVEAFKAGDLRQLSLS
jgi:predicted Fe-Mo cluster-binding NifX family protein